MAMPDEPFAVRRKIGLERSYDGCQYAADGWSHGFSLMKHLESSTPHRQKETVKLQMQATYFPQSIRSALGFLRSLLVIVFRVTRSQCLVASGDRCPNPNCTTTFTLFCSRKLR